MARLIPLHKPKRDFTNVMFDAEQLLDRAREAIRKSDQIIERTHQLIIEFTQLRSAEETELLPTD